MQSLCEQLVERSINNTLSPGTCFEEDINYQHVCVIYLGIYFQDKSICKNFGQENECKDYIF